MSKRSHRRHSAPFVDDDLLRLMQEIERFAGTEPSAQAFERLALILTRPGKRIARTRLEHLLARDEADPDDIDAVVNAALFQFYQSISQHKAGHSPFHWFSSMVRVQARGVVLRKHHACVEPDVMVPTRERASPVGEADGGVPRAAERTAGRLSPADRELREMVAEGCTEVEIAMRIHKPVWCVRKEVKKLREARRAAAG